MLKRDEAKSNTLAIKDVKRSCWGSVIVATLAAGAGAGCLEGTSLCILPGLANVIKRLCFCLTRRQW